MLSTRQFALWYSMIIGWGMTVPAFRPPVARRVMIIFNPTAGGAKGRRLRRTLAALEGLGCTLVLRETAQRGDAEAFAAQARLDEVDVVVAAGGDGTMNEVLNGLMSLPVSERPPLGIIPLGTANVLALEIQQKLSPDAIAQTLAYGQPQPVHLALVQPLIQRAPARYIMLMAGAGFDAHVVENVRLGLKRHTGKMAYVVETFWQALRYSFPRLVGSSDAGAFDAATVVICNGRLYGGPFAAAPDGNLETPNLRVIVLPRAGLWNVVRYGLALMRGRLPLMSDVGYGSSQEVVLQAPEGMPLQADGDIVAHLPVRLSVAPEGVALLRPAGASGKTRL